MVETKMSVLLTLEVRQEAKGVPASRNRGKKTFKAQFP